MRCPEECEKQWRPKQRKPGQQKQKEKEAKEEAKKKREEKAERQKKRRQKKEKTIEVKRMVEEQEIWDKEEEAAKSEVKAKKLVPEKFYKWIKVFGKKQSERMPIRKIQDHTIDMKEGFVPRKGKVYLLSREERQEVHVVATIRQNDTCSILTSAKLSVGYLVMGITRELDKEPSLYCSSIYTNTMWSML